MRSTLRTLTFFVVCCIPLFTFGQQQISSPAINCPGVPGACGYVADQSTLRTGPNTPQNGNGSLANIYSLTKCGLDFTSASLRLSKRVTPQGVNQPAPFVIAGVPPGAVIEKAYLWAEGSGNGAPQTATVNGPLGPANYPMAIVGQGPDKCWGYSGSYTYRADVTASVNGNGTYNISGILTNPPTPGNDMDGASLVVIWSDVAQSWRGTIIIDDGAVVINGGNTTHTMTFPAVCGPTTNGKAFFGVGDIQFNPNSWSANSTPAPLTWNWWDYVQVNTTVNSGQSTSPFSISSSGDCYNLCFTGLYYRTTCVSCSVVTLATSSTPTTCTACDGTATVVPTPSGSYTYSWAPSGGTGSTATGLCAGTYTVSATTGSNTYTATVVVTSVSSTVTMTNSVTNPSCYGGCNGSATVTATSGTSPYTFSWAPVVTNSTVGSTNTATGLCAGSYVVTVTDANGCTGTQTVIISDPAALGATTSFVTSTCGNPNGSATVNPSGGNPGYTYLWTPSNQTTQTATGLAANTYSCLITDANGCQLTATVIVPNAGSPTASISSSTNITCNGACDGTITATGTGGTLPYTYSWSPSGGTGAAATALCPGSYTCTITDANGCTSTASATITQPLVITIVPTHIDLVCNGVCNGSATVAVSGGTPGYTYAWSPSGGNNATASSLCAGNYSCLVTDLNGCTSTQTFTITEPTLLTVTSAGFNVTCFGSCDGQIVAIPAGGTSGYTFSWTTGCTSPSCNNICAGTYSVTVTDLNGCTATSSAVVTQPTAINLTTSTVAAHCNQADGSASVISSGGTGTLSPVWYMPSTPGNTLPNVVPGNYYVIVTDANGCTDTANVTVANIPGVTANLGTVTNVSCNGGSDGTANITVSNGTGIISYAWSCSPSTTTSAINLSPGTCTVVATDSAGCTSSVTFTVTEPTALSLSATATPASICVGQSTSIAGSASGGTPGYNYAWLPGPLAGQTQTVTPATTTTYSLVVTDANGCIDSTTVAVNVNDIPVAILSGDLLMGCAPLCVNFSDISTIGSGTINQWTWDFGDGSLVSTQQNPSHCYPTAGTYSVTLTVSTSAGCNSTIVMPSYIQVFPVPVAAFSANPQPTTELNPTIYFTDESTGATVWNWSFGDLIPASSSNLQNPSFTYPITGCFDVQLEVESSNGCVDSTIHQVCIDPDVTFYVPNAFTPNGDGINDVFYPQGLNIDRDHFEMWIFDRWGNMIFYTDDLSKGWDGAVQGHTDLCQQDVYVWKIKALDLLGNKHNIIGHVSLIR